MNHKDGKVHLKFGNGGLARLIHLPQTKSTLLDQDPELVFVYHFEQQRLHRVQLVCIITVEKMKSRDCRRARLFFRIQIFRGFTEKMLRVRSLLATKFTYVNVSLLLWVKSILVSRKSNSLSRLTMASGLSLQTAPSLPLPGYDLVFVILQSCAVKSKRQHLRTDYCVTNSLRFLEIQRDIN